MSKVCTCSGIILTENEFEIYYAHTKPYVHNQIWYEYQALTMSDICLLVY